MRQNATRQREDAMSDGDQPDPQNRSPAPDAAPEDNPEPDALKDADIKSGTESGEAADDDQRSGVAGPAAGTTEGDDAVGIV
jgi:hypothetical protein